MLMDEYFSQEQPDLLVSAKVGPDATAVWSAYAQRVPVGDWARPPTRSPGTAPSPARP